MLDELPGSTPQVDQDQDPSHQDMDQVDDMQSYYQFEVGNEYKGVLKLKN
jgi:hypothetical protein